MLRKPIKRSAYIVSLSRDHHASLLFCWKLRQGVKKKVENTRLQRYVNYFFKEHLLAHFEEEETILFAPYIDENVDRAFSEHQIIIALIERILKDPNANYDDYTLLANRVDDHVRWEERELFPHLEKVLTQQQLELIRQQLSDEIHVDTFADDFWSRNKN